MKLDSMQNAQSYGVPQANQKMSEIRNGNWLLTLEREQLSGRSSYRPAEEKSSNSEQGANHQKASLLENRTWSASTKPLLETREKSNEQIVQTVHSFAAYDPMVISTWPAGKSSIAVATALADGEALPANIGRGVSQSEAEEKNASSLTEKNIGPDLHDAGSESNANSQLEQNIGIRQIHLYSREGSVQVWIRDSAMDSVSMTPVAEALKQELKKNGHELIGLTINGKKMASLLKQSQLLHSEKIQSPSV